MNLWADNPDYYATAQLPLLYNMTGITGDFTVASGGRRSGTNAIFINPSTGSLGLQSKTPVGSGDDIIGIAFAIKFTTFPIIGGQKATFFIIGDATVWHFGIRVNEDGTIGFWRGTTPGGSGGTLIGNSSNAILLDTWYSFSILATIHDTTGTLSFKLNGAEELNGGAGYTNIDTQNAGTATWTRFAFASILGTGTNPRTGFYSYCDLVVNDGTGSVNNGHPGDCSVLVDIPNAVNGSNTGFTPNGGTFHGDRVREIPLDDDTTYNASTATGQRDTYVFPNLVMSAGTPLSVINRMALKKTEAGVATAVGVVYDISAATNYDSAVSLAPSEASYAYFDDIRELDPNTTAAWDVAGINDKEFGVKRAT